MSYSQMIELLKQKHKGQILFVKTGAFYVATAEDAIYLHEKLALKCTCFKNNICKVGIPIMSLSKYVEKLNVLPVGYVIYDFCKEKEQLEIKIQKQGKSNPEQRIKLNCIECKGINKYIKEDKYIKAVKKLYET